MGWLRRIFDRLDPFAETIRAMDENTERIRESTRQIEAATALVRANNERLAADLERRNREYLAEEQAVWSLPRRGTDV